MKTPVLETDRLILRPLSLSDAPALQKHFDNWNIIQNLSAAVPWPYPENGAEEFFREYCLPMTQAGKIFIWSIFLKERPGEAIGVIEFRLEKKQDGNRGFWLAEPFHGRGLMTEAAGAVNDFVFDTLGLESFVASNAKSNSRSRRVKEKTGAVFVGTGELLHHNGESEMELWLITRESWQKAKKKT